jgi:hypothetical protein
VHSSQTTAPVQFADLRGKRRVAAEVLALAYMAIIAEVAIASGAFYILFPELAALSILLVKIRHFVFVSFPYFFMNPK